ncbi:hypothetical protein BJV74DRAFT_364728 [Russula compacta]|nr:hypothetical protein BJV74DRAFT_364728 [Russula compacta]
MYHLTPGPVKVPDILRPTGNRATVAERFETQYGPSITHHSKHKGVESARRNYRKRLCRHNAMVPSGQTAACGPHSIEAQQRLCSSGSCLTTKPLLSGAPKKKIFTRQIVAVLASIIFMKLTRTLAGGTFSDLFLTCSVRWTVKLWRAKSLAKPSTTALIVTSVYSFDEADDIYVCDVKWHPAHLSVFASVESLTLEPDLTCFLVATCLALDKSKQDDRLAQLRVYLNRFPDLKPDCPHLLSQTSTLPPLTRTGMPTKDTLLRVAFVVGYQYF